MDQFPQIPPEAIAALLSRKRQLLAQEAQADGTQAPQGVSLPPMQQPGMSQPQFSNYGSQQPNSQQNQQLIQLLRQRALMQQQMQQHMQQMQQQQPVQQVDPSQVPMFNR